MLEILEAEGPLTVTQLRASLKKHKKRVPGGIVNGLAYLANEGLIGCHDNKWRKCDAEPTQPQASTQERVRSITLEACSKYGAPIVDVLGQVSWGSAVQARDEVCGRCAEELRLPILEIARRTGLKPERVQQCVDRYENRLAKRNV